jgi:hypothetical protein
MMDIFGLLQPWRNSHVRVVRSRIDVDHVADVIDLDCEVQNGMHDVCSGILVKDRAGDVEIASIGQISPYLSVAPGELILLRRNERSQKIIGRQFTQAVVTKNVSGEYGKTYPGILIFSYIDRICLSPMSISSSRS